MKEKIIRCLEFNELNEDQKKTVLNKYRDINVEDFSLIIDESLYKKPIEDAGFNDPKLHWDLSCCQGSGASFDCDSVDCNKALKDWNHRHKKWIIRILEEFCMVKTCQNSFACHYSHGRTRHVAIENLIPCNYYYIQLATCSALSHIEQLRLDLCSKLYKDLQDEYDRLISDEAIIETFEANEYLFNEETLSIERV